MNDRYLFRAKRIDNGEWAEGSLFAEGKITKIIRGTCNTIGIEGVDVNPETICQCIGLKDKNGKLIWENDIVRIVGHHSDVNGVYKIIFDEINHCWALERSYEYPRSYFTFSNLNGFEVDCEVIGNIFDNPELLN